MLLLNIDENGEPQHEAQVAWSEAVRAAIAERGEADGLLWLMGQRLYDWHAPVIERAIPF